MNKQDRKEAERLIKLDVLLEWYKEQGYGSNPESGAVCLLRMSISEAVALLASTAPPNLYIVR